MRGVAPDDDELLIVLISCPGGPMDTKFVVPNISSAFCNHLPIVISIVLVWEKNIHSLYVVVATGSHRAGVAAHDAGSSLSHLPACRSIRGWRWMFRHSPPKKYLLGHDEDSKTLMYLGSSALGRAETCFTGDSWQDNNMAFAINLYAFSPFLLLFLFPNFPFLFPLRLF